MKLYVAIATKASRHGNSSWYTPTQKQRVLNAIAEAGSDGISRDDIVNASGLAKDKVSFYLSELKRSGHIQVKGEINPALMPPKEAKLYLMTAAENAVAAIFKHQKATVEQDRAYVKYCKIKERALRPGTEAEGDTALRMAVIELIKLVF